MYTDIYIYIYTYICIERERCIIIYIYIHIEHVCTIIWSDIIFVPGPVRPFHIARIHWPQNGYDKISKEMGSLKAPLFVPGTA